MILELEKWIQDNPPEKIPYRDGAAYTTGFGLRQSQEVLEMGGSPLHLGVDRGFRPPIIRQPWDGIFDYQVVGGVAGSILRSHPQSLFMELQCFHSHKATVLKGGSYAEKGFHLANAGDLGFSKGAHTHTEIIFPYSEEMIHWLRSNYPSSFIVYNNGDELKTNNNLIYDHCEKYGLDSDLVMKKIQQQVPSWQILEVREVYAIRKSMPAYRTPHWGEGPTIHVDSRRLFKI